MYVLVYDYRAHTIVYLPKQTRQIPQNWEQVLLQGAGDLQQTDIQRRSRKCHPREVAQTNVLYQHPSDLC